MNWASSIKVFLAPGITDLRKSIDGLSILVADQMELDLFSGYLFGFCNRNRNLIKMLYWDQSGFCLWMKRLEKSKFIWPDSGCESLSITQRELNWLLDGLDLKQKNAHRNLTYQSVF